MLMARQTWWRWALVVVALSAVCAGCSTLGAAQQAPVNPVGTADLKPTQPDPSAGLVTVRSGFDVKKYPALAILVFPVTDSGVMSKEEAKLTVSIPPYSAPDRPASQGHERVRPRRPREGGRPEAERRGPPATRGTDHASRGRRRYLGVGAVLRLQSARGPHEGAD